MSDSWDKMKKAKEDQYFQKLNQEALERIGKRQEEDTPRLSPISGEPMKEETIMGVVVDRCNQSGGIWLDRGELEVLMSKVKGESEDQTWLLDSFFKYLK